jgi:streptogramin lyase
MGEPPVKQKAACSRFFLNHRRSALALGVAAAFGLTGVSGVALASTITVTNCTDHDPGSLRAAVANAVEGDTIDLSSLTCSAITLTTAEISINRNNLIIEGGSPGGTFFSGGMYISGHGNYRIFDHQGTGTLELDNLTIANGKYRNSTAKGGCIYSKGSVSLSHSLVTDCIATATAGIAGGGGIYALKTVQLNDSTISDNLANSVNGTLSNTYGGGLRATTLIAKYSTIHGNRSTVPSGHPTESNNNNVGGGAFVYGGASIVANTTVDGNYAYSNGGGIKTVGGSLDISNSTISGNSSSGGTAGISAGISANPTVLTLDNSTVAFNRSANSGGVGIYATGMTTLQSSILADNTTTNDFIYDFSCFNCSLAGANNLIQGFGTNVGGAAPAGLITVTGEPQLTTLGNHGGLTKTHSTLATSPAIAAGGNSLGFSFDQRGTGFPRETGVGLGHSWTDIGAFQTQLVDDEIFFNGFEPQFALLHPWVNTVRSGLTSPRGVAVDSVGNIFVADADSNSVLEILVGGGYSTVKTLGNGFSSPYGVAIDQSGNVFVADTGNNAIKEILAAGGYTTVSNLGSGFNGPVGIAVDASGNVFVADTGNNAVKEILAVNGGIPPTPTILTLGSANNLPTSVALDSSKDIFIIANYEVKELLSASGYATTNVIGYGFQMPVALAVDGDANVYVADTGNNSVKEILASSGYATVNPLAAGFNAPAGVAVSNVGNVFVGDTSGLAVKEIVLH